MSARAAKQGNPGRAPAARLWPLALWLGLAAAAAPSVASPDYGGPILPGLDPVLGATRDPRLLGAERLAVRSRLLTLGCDPARGDSTPTLESAWRALMHREGKVDLERRLRVVEIDGLRGLETTLEYPAYFVLFPAAETLPGGFVWYPPRPVDAAEVRLWLDDPGEAFARRQEVFASSARHALLDVRQRKDQSGVREALLNLTIPIKLPRTLERIIGRGEMTNIRITGREHISIAGESTVTNRYTATERRSKPSLFPTLDMQQQLQINLAGTIGEKINIEVDHNSEAIGPEATKIRLSYRGTEDEIIRTIETGDVGLTLPGSQLLGYASNKSGLFGIKVTGQVGRLEFTTVASKQKAESASKSFNSRGGESTEHIIEAQNYLKNRFFRLDLPPAQFAPGDAPGRPPGLAINPSSVQIYLFIGGGRPQPGDVDNVALYLDDTGRWDYQNPAFFDARDPIEWGERWRPVDYDLLLDQSGAVVAIDLLREYGPNDVLGVIYDVVGSLQNPGGTLIYEVGDDPGVDEGNRQAIIPDDETRYLRMKLLKPRLYDAANAHAWGYPLRNIYPLGGINIDAESFELRVEFNDQSLAHPDQDTSGLTYLQIFGLDRTNPQGQGGPDNIVDKENTYLFDLQRGLLKFPLDFPEPFNASEQQYAGYANDPSFDWAASRLSTNRLPAIYDWQTNINQYNQYNKWRLVARHAAASGTINLRDANIEEGSETVVLDGRTLQRGVDYDIDYNFGLITLKGDAAARLGPDSQIGVNYQYAPFFGGGRSSLVGVNLGLDLGRDSKVSTTLLFESTQISGHKAKLGEEPSRTLVGNLNVQHTFRPYFLTHAANFLSRNDSDKESTLQFNGEVAASVPNPNTRGMVFLEDFEGIDSSDLLPISRLSWMWGSAPAQGRDPAFAAATGDLRDFTPPRRAETRWFLPRDNVLRRYLNPDLRDQEGREPQQVLQLFLDAGEGGWQSDSWGGIMRGLGRNGIDLSKAQFLEFWVNDFVDDPSARRGTLHIDFGYLNEDFFWPVREGGTLEVGTYQFEDANRDGVFTFDEDTGLDGVMGGSSAPDYYDVAYVSDDDPYPRINGTEANNREDTEDLDGDTVFDRQDGYFTLAVNLADSALVDVRRDFDPGRLSGLPAGQSWRKFRIRLGDTLPVSPPGGTTPQINAVTHVRIWFEDGSPGAARKRQLQLSEIKFLGSRWEREGIRKRLTEDLLTPAERGPAESFFIGEVNNKENPDYQPPFAVREDNRIPEKEQSIVLDFQNLERDHLARISKFVSPQGDDYTQYTSLTYYLYSPRHEQRDLDTFFRLGADTLNYYEISYRFDERDGPKTGWKQLRVDIAELSNAKFGPVDPERGWIATTVTDPATGEVYRVRVVGRPDLRRVRRFYFGVVNDGRSEPVSGYFYFNDVRLEEVKRENGFAERVAMRLNMADVLKVDFDWSQRDADFHGLNAAKGQGFHNQDWNLSSSFRLDDFVPMLGFQMPINVGRQQSIQRPKYLTNSDIELIDEDIRNAQSKVDTRESYGVRLSHKPSRAALPRYLVDPWSFSLSGSRASSQGPLERSRGENMQGTVSYDLSLTGRYALGRYLFLDEVPLLRDLLLLPRKISFAGNFSSADRTAQTIGLDGSVTPRPSTLTRRAALSASVEYAPLPVADISLTVKSDRDLLRPQNVLGVNLGEENQYTQGVQVRFTPPRAPAEGGGLLLKPVRAAIQGLNQLRPQITFSGQYTNNHDPAIRQVGDPPGTSNVSNGGDWDFRFSLPLDKFVRAHFPERGGPSERERQQLIERQRRSGRRGRPGGEEAPPPGDQSLPPQPPGSAPPDTAGGQSFLPPAGWDEDELLTPEERQRREEEALLEQAREQAERERDEARARGEQPPPEPQPAEPGRGRFRVPNPAQGLLGLLRNTAPIQMSYSVRKSSAYGRLRQEAPFWYRVGLSPALDIADSLYAVSSLNDRQTMSLSTSIKVMRQVSADVKFAKTTSERDQAGLVQGNYQQDWPDLRVAVTGLERWSVFGGGGEQGWFRSSNVDVAFKRSRVANGFTSTLYNPRTTTSISPRWNVTFHSGMSAALNLGLSEDVSVINGTRNEAERLNIGLQVRHSFRAERLLARLNLYRPGSTPTINMDVDVSYARDTNQRRLPQSSVADAQTGQSRLSVNPRFSYQVTRNLSGAVRFIFTRQKIFESDIVNKTFGLGLEATFVF